MIKFDNFSKIKNPPLLAASRRSALADTLPFGGSVDNKKTPVHGNGHFTLKS